VSSGTRPGTQRPECDKVILPVVDLSANGEPVRKVEITVPLSFTASARKLGVASAVGTALMVAVHAWASAETKVFSLMALLFMSLVAGLTCSIHFVIFTVGRQAAFSGNAWMQLFLSFKWPSVSYALDILAWDVFFAPSALFAAPVFSGNRLAKSIRVLLVASGALALAGLSGVIVGDMRLRNIGIVGYAGVFPVVSLLLAILFHRTTPRQEAAARRHM
jgi:hypothetical protein